MRPFQLEGVGRDATLTLRRIVNSPFDAQLSVGREVGLYLGSGDQALLAHGGASEHIEVQGAGKDSTRRLRLMLEAKLPSVCWIAAIRPKREPRDLVIRAHTFSDEIPFEDPLEIGADDKILEQARTIDPGANLNPDGLGDWLQTRLLLGGAHPLERGVRGVASGSGQSGLGAGAFDLHGIDLTAMVRTDLDGRLNIDHLAPRRLRAQTPLVLVRGPISFVDATEGTSLRTEAAAQVATMADGDGDYLELWRRYEELDLRRVLRRAQDVGSLQYEGWEDLDGPDGMRVRFRLSSPESCRAFVRRLGTRGEIAAGAEMPEEFSEDADRGVKRGLDRPQEVRGSLTEFDREHGGWLEFKPYSAASGMPPANGYLYMSLGGDSAARKRRERARDQVHRADIGIPRLARMLEGNIAWQARRRARRIPALSRRAREALGGRPTPHQLEALDVALNTPDLAVIQGPPGTGKTGVIAALAVRLTELAEERAELGEPVESTLLTSYQNEAVANVGRRTNVLGFPSRIVTSARLGAAPEETAVNWARKVADAVEAALAREGAPRPSELVTTRRAVRALINAYRLAPGMRKDAVETIDAVVACGREVISHEHVNRLLEIRNRIERGTRVIEGDRSEVSDALRVVRGLRVGAAGFSDDGPQRARDALLALQPLRLLTAAQAEILSALSASRPTADPAGSAALREALVDRLQDQLDEFDHPAADDELVGVFDDILGALAELVRTSGDGAGEVMADYVDALRHDPGGVEYVHRRYSRVVAATCQQSRDGTVVDERFDAGAEFNVVIVDEAARANPLDLLIPMSAARRQIVLVGDHRQLPHMLEPDVEADVAAALGEVAGARLRDSAFERLFLSLKAQEARDGIRRVVTLDRQFRMHPRLGSFIDDVFYGPHGETIENGVTASDRTHDVPRFLGRVAAWEDVPHTAGLEERAEDEDGSRSLARPAEAEIVVDLLEEVTHTGEEAFSVGVVTFYSGQETEILRLCLDRGLAYGSPKRHEHQFAGVLADRVSVGTVDAFQGREFDVVILSPVRSNTRPTGTLGLTRYGFLTFENRMCVAMSRARRLLIVAGDRAFAQGADAKRWIPALQRFSALCGSEEALIRDHAA